MIPSILDRQIRQGVADFVRTTFSITTPSMAKMVDDLCDEPDRMFKGPYISLGLPFENGNQPADLYFPQLKVPFLLFKHQELAWERLTKFQSSLIATGTGSGKTECFLYPVLNHVRMQKERGWSGIKAILVYPMNALATDQAKRIAIAIEADPALKGKITAALYVGGEQENPDKVMGPKTIITDRKTMRLSPPDILLTNYKMLDYLLTRPKDKPLWAANRPGNENGPSTLRFLVVDELHTFDGAQGTDLAMLIRRLKHRLGCMPGDLCCVGTSATLGGPESSVQMLHYAQQIFGESFAPEALITEQRQSPAVYLAESHMETKGSGFPIWQNRALLQPGSYKTPEEYLESQARIWFPEEPAASLHDRIKIGQLLKGHVVFRVLIDIVTAIPRTEKDILSELARHFEALDPKYLAGENSGVDISEIEEFLSLCLSSIISLIAHARRRHPSKKGEALPFVQQVRVQSWTRELRRMVATVSTHPRLDFADDINQDKTHFLPVVYCRECGNAGWVGLVPNQSIDELRSDDKALGDFYKTFFQHKPSQHIRFLFPDLKSRAILKPGRTADDIKLCVTCLKMLMPTATSCSCGGNEFVEVLVPDSRYQDSKGHWFTRKHCPGCGTRQSLVVLGAQSASLSSALINQLFASPYNTDKKLIAFSDNVQDAAHRASFFGARTWKFNFRAAIQQYLQTQTSPQLLIGLGGRVLDFWKNQFKNEIETVAMFLPSDLEWLMEVRESQAGNRKEFSQEFWSALAKRLDWEVFTEYGLDCRKGRTLEKSGCSAIFVAYQGLQPAYDELSIRLQNLDPCLQEKIQPIELRQLIHGIIRRWLHNGAIEHPALGSYIANLGNPYLIHKNSYWMKGFGEHSRTPAFAWRQIPGKDNQERLDPIESRTDRPTSWYAHWLLKHWGQTCPMLLSHFEEAMQCILDFMVRTGIAIRREAEGTYLWMLNPDKIEVNREVRHFRCHVCSHQVSVPSIESSIFQGLRCLKASCGGAYAPYELTGRYYGDLYNNGNLIRLMPSEHTALLERDERETIEKQFKAKPEERSPWAPNLLSCTPTLELGIDIGDLSSVLLCSVPPEQAAFLQRIGRAGRTDGNAVVSTIAEGQPHDLYFWADPLEMLHGILEPPGVFLDATAVLERQLMAFCLDRWVYKDESAAMPRQVSAMISNWKASRQGVFPVSFVTFVRDNASAILKDFLGLLGGSITQTTGEYLTQFLDCTNKAGGFGFKINECLGLSEKMRNSLTGRKKQLDGDIAKKKADPGANPELIDELQMERDALMKLVRNIDERDCFRFLTDEGLVPNYAFPEAGVQLKSIVYRRDRSSGGAGTKTFKTIYEYERAAATAISDFAPGNYFYAHRRRVQIDQVDHNVSPPEMFRLCPECGYMELEVKGATPAECPQCQCARFGAQRQVQQLLRIRQVYATSGDRKSLVGDDSDSRDVRFFERSMLVGLRDSELLGAWQLDDTFFPFGFEVRRKVLLRELNFGPFNAQNGGVRIAGKDISADGFEICKSCGKVGINDDPIKHTFHCAEQHPNNNQQLLQATFLFRDFEGEALRIFLPTLSQGADKDIKSFLAALHLGLKLHYQGDVSHLQATLQSEPIPGNDNLRKQFIVLYDRIPGGTGYLKQFTQDPSLLRTILQKSLDRMSACACQHASGRDGCYRCLFAHRNSREMELISRRTAMELSRKILDPKLSFKKLETGVSKIDLIQVLESELEKKFISTLKDYSELPGAEHRVKIEPKALDAGNGYHLSVDDQVWIVEPQVLLDEAKGTSVPTRIDFLITHAENKNLMPIALSLDGWEYHHARMETDTRQRLALHRTGKFLIWTITWDDINDALKPSPVSAGLLGISNSAGFQAFLAKKNMLSWQDIVEKGSMRLLLKYLSLPNHENWKYTAYGIVMSNVEPEKTDGAAWVSSVSRWLPGSHSGWDPIWQGMASKRNETIAEWNAWVGREIKQNAVVLRMNDATIVRGDDKQCWQDYWRTVNVFQFIPDFIFVIEQAVIDGSYNGIPMSAPAFVKATMSAAWQELFELYSDERVGALMKEALAAGFNPPIAFHEIVENETIIAQTEIAWPDQKVAIVCTSDDKKTLLALGWKVQSVGDIENGQLLTWLKE
jgi:Distinct helicase family with a unique C-terminal domain including a metal-binding cysteine cluster